jgi:hypothetical protein
MLNGAPALTQSNETSSWRSSVAELVSRFSGVAVKRPLQKR